MQRFFRITLPLLKPAILVAVLFRTLDAYRVYDLFWAMSDRQLESLSTVRSVRMDRAFPHTLRITVVPERPLAVVRRGQDAWLVSEQGRVIRELDPGRRNIRINNAETKAANPDCAK